jgi:L-ascorbate metabolism protein UlaG (beta-lactamase superfamily)
LLTGSLAAALAAAALRLWREGGFAGATSGVSRIPVASRAPFPLSADWLAWLRPASFLLRLGGLTVAVDPVLSARILGAGQRFTRPGVGRLPPLDLPLISHNHYDHLDAPTLRPVARETPVVAPCGLDPWFRRRGFTAVTELRWWKSARVGALEVTFVPAHHWSRRGLFDHCASLWSGFVVTVAGGLRVYHAGDSGYGPFFASIGSRCLGIDLTMLPIGAYVPRWFMRNMHMDPDEGVQAASDVGTRVMVPMHWGTFWLSLEPVLEPINHPGRLGRRGPGSQESVGSRGTGEPPALSTPACFYWTVYQRSGRSDAFVPILQLLLIVTPRIR